MMPTGPTTCPDSSSGSPPPTKSPPSPSPSPSPPFPSRPFPPIFGTPQEPAKTLHALSLKTGVLPRTIPGPTPLFLSHPSSLTFLLSAFARRGFPSLALRALALAHRLALPLDSYALSAALSAAISESPPHGAQIHARAAKSGWASSVFVGGALVDFYVKLGSIRHARRVFDEIPVQNTVCANALLAGYVESRRWNEGLSFLVRMNGLGLEADGFTLSSVLGICAGLAAVDLGVQAHAHMIRKIGSAEADVFLFGALVEMYGRCGLAGKARLVFESARKDGRRSDVVLWTSMLNAYGRNGRFDDVIGAFEEMLVEGIEPDEIALLAVLSACARSGRVLRGLSLFKHMRRGYGMVPGPEHYGCVVDMLCKAGELGKAWEFANEMVVKKRGEGGVTVWGSLLSACREFGNVEIGKVAAEKALELEPGNVGIYVELSNLYARVGMWDEIEELRVLMKENGLEKDSAFSRLERVKLIA